MLGLAVSFLESATALSKSDMLGESMTFVWGVVVGLKFCCRWSGSAKMAVAKKNEEFKLLSSSRWDSGGPLAGLEGRVTCLPLHEMDRDRDRGSSKWAGFQKGSIWHLCAFTSQKSIYYLQCPSTSLFASPPPMNRLFILAMFGNFLLIVPLLER